MAIEITYKSSIKKSKTILEASKKLGIKIEAPCDGKGKCGKCAIIAKGDLSEITKSERKHLSEKKISKGYRLACEAKIMGDVEILLD